MPFDKNLLLKVKQKHCFNFSPFPYAYFKTHFKRISAKSSFTLPSNTLKDFHKISKKFAESLSIYFSQQWLLYEPLLLHIRTMNGAILWHVLAPRRLFHFIECFVCFVFFIYLWNIPPAGIFGQILSVFIVSQFFLGLFPGMHCFNII